MTVEIYRDAWGVPHLRADDALELARAQGRSPPTTAPGSWRSNGTGRGAPRPRSSARTRSRWDRFARQARLDDTARRCFTALERRDPETAAWVRAYVDGVNEGLPEGARRAPEFTTVGLAPGRWEPWTPLGVWLATHVLFAGFPAKLWREEVVRHLGPDAVGLFATDGPGTAGSNGWLVTGERTATGAPVIAGDPHRYIEAPGVYQQIRLSCPEFDVIGLAVPGVPGIAHFGHTGTVAWAITNAMADYQDLYRERLRRTGHGDRVEALGPDGAWHRAARHTEIVEVADGDPVEVEVIETDRGPVVVDGDFTGGDADPDLDGVPNGGGPAGPLSLRYPPRVTEDLGFCAPPPPPPRPPRRRRGPRRSTTGPSPSTSSRPPTPRAASCTGSRAGSPSGARPTASGSSPAWEPGHEWRGWHDPCRAARLDDGIAVMANQRGPATPLGVEFAPPHRADPASRALLGTRRDLVRRRHAAIHMDTHLASAAPLLDHLAALDGLTPEAASLRDRLLPGTATWTPTARRRPRYAAVRGAVVRRLAAHPALARLTEPPPTPRSSAPGSPSSRASASPSKPAQGRGVVRDRPCRGRQARPSRRWPADPPSGHMGRHPPPRSLAGAAGPLARREGTRALRRPRLRAVHLRRARRSPTGPRAAPPPATCGTSRDRENSLWVVPFGASGVPDSAHHRDQLPLWVRGDLVPVVTDWSRLTKEEPTKDELVRNDGKEGRTMTSEPYAESREAVHEQVVDGLGTVRVLRVDPDADLDVLHAWVTAERARFWGMGGFGREQVLETYGTGLPRHPPRLPGRPGRQAGRALPDVRARRRPGRRVLRGRSRATSASIC